MGSGKGRTRRAQSSTQMPSVQEQEQVLKIIADKLAHDPEDGFNKYFLNVSADSGTISEEKFLAVIAPLLARNKLRRYREIVCPADWTTTATVSTIKEEHAANLLVSGDTVDCKVCGQAHPLTDCLGEIVYVAGDAYVHGEDLEDPERFAAGRLHDFQPVDF